MEPLEEMGYILHTKIINIVIKMRSENEEKLTADIWPAMLFSATKVGIFPPGVLEVAISHSTFPPSSSRKRSTLA